MNSSVIGLFQYTRSRVSDQDIIDFSPNDPGYGNYVELWTRIRGSGVIPRQSDFDLSEVIGLTGWANPDQSSDPGRFRNYRRFTSAVAVALLHYGNGCDVVRVASYLAHDLIVDLDSTSTRHLSLLRAVVISTRELLSTTNLDEGYPFFTFASMILAQKAGDWKSAEAAATQLIEDEHAVRSDEAFNWSVRDDRFLLGLSGFDQFHADWILFARGLDNPTHHEDTQLVINELTSSWITN